MLGRLLRGVQPELMDALIQASKDGNWSGLQALSGVDTLVVEDFGKEDEADEEDYEEEDEVRYRCFYMSVYSLVKGLLGGHIDRLFAFGSFLVDRFWFNLNLESAVYNLIFFTSYFFLLSNNEQYKHSLFMLYFEFI